MKNKIIALLVTMILLTIWICPAFAEQALAPAEIEDDAEIEEIPEEDEMLENWFVPDGDDDDIWGEMVEEDDYWINSPENILRAAMEVYSWFEVQPLDVDIEAPNSSGAMWRVLDERFNTYAALTDFVYFYFTDEIAQELLSRGLYAEEGGVLYAKRTIRPIDERMVDFDIVITDEDEARIGYKVTVKYSGPDDQRPERTEFTFIRDKINGEWRFTVFPFFW